MKPTELPVPSAVGADPEAIELLRVWAAGGKQHVSLATEVWDDPAAWGIMLVDLARHIASAYEQSSSQPYVASLKRIRETFDAEWEHATDEPSGGIVD
jgi:hypothetical protein